MFDPTGSITRLRALQIGCCRDTPARLKTLRSGRGMAPGETVEAPPGFASRPRSVCPSVCLFACLSVCLSVVIAIRCVLRSSSAPPSWRPGGGPPFREGYGAGPDRGGSSRFHLAPPFCLSFCLSVCLSICLSVCLSIVIAIRCVLRSSSAPPPWMARGSREPPRRGVGPGDGYRLAPPCVLALLLRVLLTRAPCFDDARALFFPSADPT